MVPILTSSILTHEGFAHAFSLRPADFSLTVSPGLRKKTIEELCAHAGMKSRRVEEAAQVHGARTLVVPSQRGADREADALFARGSVLEATGVGVRTADCVPILVGDSASGHVAAIHAGWKGLVAGVIEAAIGHFSNRDSLVCAIGPCIERDAFEVGEEVALALIEACETDSIVQIGPNNKPHVDLRRSAHIKLETLGVRKNAIEHVGGCTYRNNEHFFSFRRDKENAGRHLAVIETRNRRRTS